MELEKYSALATWDSGKCCNCGCSSCSLGFGWLRSVKRKHDDFEQGRGFFIPGFDFGLNPRVQIENECSALRETVASQQQVIQDLYMELEEERNASSSAANEAMSMILRLQREKAEIQMEAMQFKRFAEEKMVHDQQEIVALEDLLYKREQTVQALMCELQAYKHRMLSYGIMEDEAEERGGFSRNTSMNENLGFDFPVYEYPPLKCMVNENPNLLEGDDDDIVDIEKYAFEETPRGRENLRNLEYRINLMERSPRNCQMDADFLGSKNVMEKVVVGQSPRHTRHSRRFSTDSANSFPGVYREIGLDVASESPNSKLNNSFKKMNYFPQAEDHSNSRRMDNASEFGDDMSDRIYTIDSVHNGVASTVVAQPKPGGGVFEDYLSTPREAFSGPDLSDPDIKKLYKRLQTLEADRESMRQAIISMGTDKAQLVLLKEIAQQLCKDVTPERQLPVGKPSVLGSFSFMSVFKWIPSFIFWRRRARQSKYMFGLSSSNAGLLMLLDNGPGQGSGDALQGRCYE